MKDYDRLKQYICKNQPSHELCDGNDEDGDDEKDLPTLAPTLPTPKKLGFWAWQNLVVYAGCAIILFGLIKVLGCCEKSLEQKIVEAQLQAMQPLVPDTQQQQ